MTLVNLKTGGGPWGYGLLTLPLTASINLLIIPAVLILKKQYNSSKVLLIINLIGFLWALFLLYLFLTVPRT
jgi:hypothetical protein